MKGKVKWYDEVKGFGFIVSENNQDIFVHRSGLVNSMLGLKEGQEVEFETREGHKWPVAFNVQ